MSMSKDEILTAIEKFETSIPHPLDDGQLGHDRYFQKLISFVDQIVPTTGKLTPFLLGKLKSAYDVPESGDACGSNITKDQKARVFFCENIPAFLTLLKDWVIDGFEKGIFPIQQQAQIVQVKGWWFSANGIKVILQVKGINIDLSKRVRGTGKGIAIIICNLLSQLNKTEVTKTTVEDVLDNRGEEYKGRTVQDAVRNLNTLVREKAKIDFDFLQSTDSGYKVNQKVWE